MNPLQSLTQLEADKATNEAALSNGLDYVAYIREDLRIAHETRCANLRLQAEMISEIMAAKQTQMKERMARNG